MSKERLGFRIPVFFDVKRGMKLVKSLKIRYNEGALIINMYGEF